MKIKKIKIAKAFEKISLVFTMLIVVLIIYLAASQIMGRVPFICNRAVLHIVSGSMEPLIPTDTYVLIEKTSPDEVEVGDIITFYSRDESIYGYPNTHKVIQVVGEGENLQFQTQGVNENTNTQPDNTLVEREDFIGIYQKNLNGFTKIAEFMSQKMIFFFLIVIPALFLVTYQIKEIAQRAKQVKIEKLIEQEVERLKNEGINKNV